MNRKLQTVKFGGIDERRAFSDELAYMPVLKNYQVTENYTLRKRDGILQQFPAPAAITGMWSGYLGDHNRLLFTADGKLFEADPLTYDLVEIGPIGNGTHNVMFEFCRRVYIKNEQQYSYYDGEQLHTVTGYVPLVAIGCQADGSGSSFEDINMLSSRRRVQYTCDGGTKKFFLPEKGATAVVAVKQDGVASGIAYSFNSADGSVTFASAPASGENRLEITYDMGTDRSDVIMQASGVMLFGGDTDGHVFLWGNPSYAGYRFHSELADGLPSAEYFPENNYTVIGDSEITDIISQYDRQLIFTKDRAYYSYCELQTDTLGNVYASFPVYNLNGEKGSLLKNAGCIMNNEPVTLCADGLNRWSSTVVANEKNAVCFSGAVGKTLQKVLASGDYDGMRLFNLRGTGELFFIYGDDALIYNYRIGAWYAYDNFAAEYMAEFNGRLFFSRGAAVLALDETSTTDGLEKVDAVLETPFCMPGGMGARGKATRVDLVMKMNSSAVLEFSYYGGQANGNDFQPLPQTQTVKLFGPWDQLRDVSIRPPVHRFPFFKMRLRQKDYSYTEICGLQITAVQKGTYGRKRI